MKKYQRILTALLAAVLVCSTFSAAGAAKEESVVTEEKENSGHFSYRVPAGWLRADYGVTLKLPHLKQWIVLKSGILVSATTAH